MVQKVTYRACKNVQSFKAVHVLTARDARSLLQTNLVVYNLVCDVLYQPQKL